MGTELVSGSDSWHATGFRAVLARRTLRLGRYDSRLSFAHPENNRVAHFKWAESEHLRRQIMIQRYRSFLSKGYMAVAASLFLVAVMCHSQGTNATVSGVISDPTGAVVPGTSVSLTDLATGIVTKAVSDSQGFYRIRGLSRTYTGQTFPSKVSKAKSKTALSCTSETRLG